MLPGFGSAGVILIGQKIARSYLIIEQKIASAAFINGVGVTCGQPKGVGLGI